MPDETVRFLYPENEYSRSIAGRSIFLDYRFKDFEGRDRKFGCQIDFDMSESLRRDLGVPSCSKAFSGRDFVCWVPGQKLPHGGRETDFIFSKKSSEITDYLYKIGLHKEGEDSTKVWGLNYSPFAAKAVPAFRDCTQSLEDLAGWSDETAMAFLLSMPRPKSEIPEIDEDSGKWTGGFLVPTSVILEDEGDCDSKAVLFGVLRQSAGRRLVIFRSRPLQDGQEDPIQHALVGIDLGGETPDPREGFSSWEEDYIKPGRYDRWQPLRFGRRKYIPIELTGPGRTEYGEVAFRSGYKSCPPDRGCLYVAIPVGSIDR